ncbi:hypothetical protein [Alteromonas oceanisediminis]|uniref:hypothetical protein n=1 Tax=Alteromonas oceanisediminis TaxID=2836180 RepID=UPI001BDAC0C8|nr:hypothetical protein [Alteromonas oceanisediminis]MBT0586873.1 hypothetical protein [Alteromonas oceanisediminis]
MNNNDLSEHTQRNLLSNIIIVLMFLGMMAAAIVYFNNASPNIKAEIMHTLAQQFGRNVTNAHWQWQAEGRPNMIMLVQYDNSGKERGRQPLRMDPAGWPHVEPTSESCEALWQSILYLPARVDGFRVIAEFYQEPQHTEVTNAQGPVSGYCRFRVSTGPYFDYYVNSGRVVSDEKD